MLNVSNAYLIALRKRASFFFLQLASETWNHSFRRTENRWRLTWQASCAAASLLNWSPMLFGALHFATLVGGRWTHDGWPERLLSNLEFSFSPSEAPSKLKPSSLSKIRSYCAAGYEVFEYSLNDAIILLSNCLQLKLHWSGQNNWRINHIYCYNPQDERYLGERTEVELGNRNNLSRRRRFRFWIFCTRLRSSHIYWSWDSWGAKEEHQGRN